MPTTDHLAACSERPRIRRALSPRAQHSLAAVETGSHSPEARFSTLIRVEASAQV
jgi:hypothetical protein